MAKKKSRSRKDMDKAIIYSVAKDAAERVDKDEVLVRLQKIVDKVVGRVRQTMMGYVADNSHSVLFRFSNNLQTRLVEMCQTWAPNQVDQIVPVLPEGTKYYTRTGVRTVVIIEQKPQMRSILVSEPLLDGCPDRACISDYQRTNGLPCQVSLPYVVFTVTFNNNQFYELRINFRTQPLRNLNDDLYFAHLPNIANGDCKVCMGSIYSNEYIKMLSGQSVAEQVEKVIGDFWQSVFNTDYPDYYKWGCNHEPKMKTLRQWMASSRLDAPFILKVKFQRQSTLGELIKRVGGGANAITDSGLGGAFIAELEKAIKGVSRQLEKWINLGVRECKLDQSVVAKALTEELADLVVEALVSLLSKPMNDANHERFLLDRMRMLEIDFTTHQRVVE